MPLAQAGCVLQRATSAAVRPRAALPPARQPAPPMPSARPGERALNSGCGLTEESTGRASNSCRYASTMRSRSSTAGTKGGWGSGAGQRARRQQGAGPQARVQGGRRGQTGRAGRPGLRIIIQQTRSPPKPPSAAAHPRRRRRTRSGRWRGGSSRSRTSAEGEAVRGRSGGAVGAGRRGRDQRGGGVGRMVVAGAARPQPPQHITARTRTPLAWSSRKVRSGGGPPAAASQQARSPLAAKHQATQTAGTTRCSPGTPRR